MQRACVLGAVRQPARLLDPRFRRPTDQPLPRVSGIVLVHACLVQQQHSGLVLTSPFSFVSFLDCRVCVQVGAMYQFCHIWAGKSALASRRRIHLALHVCLGSFFFTHVSCVMCHVPHAGHRAPVVDSQVHTVQFWRAEGGWVADSPPSISYFILFVRWCGSP